MQINSDELASRIFCLSESRDVIVNMACIPTRKPFDEEVLGFLNDASRILMKDPQSKAYSDVMTFAFWIRKASLQQLKDRFSSERGSGKHYRRVGKGVVFHIAPSNVPVNFAYSLVSGLLAGNANIVRVPSKDFPQILIIAEALNEALEQHPDLRSYIALVRYERDKEINDFFSSFADMRVVWGGDETIAELRRSPLPPRSGEITFADRYSIAVIDSDHYLRSENKERIAEDFYNDTFFSDQNACTSPCIVVWTGNSIKTAKELFWENEYALVSEKYNYQSVMGVNKLTSLCLAAADIPGLRVKHGSDNFIVRIMVDRIDEKLMDHRDNSGYFYEYDCKDIIELKPLVNDKHCQTIAYLGEKSMFDALLDAGIKGIDRIVPLGRTMDFDLIWDGYDLIGDLSRYIAVL